ncbi:flavodoxin-dependent (E)-4-hydroxy-3-methylbut-2-enyl-diphosphate synthase [bacterium]|nr:flavodoxin-dependent (E)-4-hydroxy-3-methylbut-2-enyl-diphosphate synthase [bacterium]MBU3956348.1 flavodoxin-dependent (E)-4-hydroxy-3-methylbut-2-enyl-diphosphate synthase [bacterium]
MKKIVRVGNISIGGGKPVVVQGMVKTPPSDVKTASWINSMADAGCRLVRIAVPNAVEASFLGGLRKKVKVPLVADIHFDWKLAVTAAAAGIDKIRINPSNIGSVRKVREVADVCRERGIPIRVGANSGSVKTLNKGDSPKVKARKLFSAVQKEVGVLEKARFYNIVVSAKAEDVETTIEVNRLLNKLPYPLHMGVTATGLPRDGIIKSSLALGILLREGIGDTIRVSLLADPIMEVKVAYSILSDIGLTKRKINFIACPTCGRCRVNLKAILDEIYGKFPDADMPSEKTLNVAVMGCEVNGPGEARNADLGIAFTGEKAVYFEKGKIVKTLSRASAVKFITAKIKNGVRS